MHYNSRKGCRFNNSQLAKLEKRIPPLNLYSRSSKKLQIYLKMTIFVNMWNLEQFLANNCLKVRIREFFCTHVSHINVIVICTANFVSFKSIFSYPQISPSNFVFLAQNHLALLKDRFLKKMLLKTSKQPSPFLHKITRLK